jgi:hypothetical protein
MGGKRKSFGSVVAKVHGGKPGNITLGIHFDKRNLSQAIEMARGILQAVENETGLDITVFRERKRKDGLTQVTITAPPATRN